MITRLFGSRQNFIILLCILLISLLFRTYAVVEKTGFDHDYELFSWIVKDIVDNGHLRLIGQLTTADGVFIGPLFYYLLVPFFILFQMDPIGSVIPITIIGIFATLSYFVVFKKLFNNNTGLIAAFFHAVLVNWVFFDRRVVPTTPSNLWLVWYFFCVVQLSRGQQGVLPLMAVLIGLIWHVHIALLPTLIAIPIALIIAKKIPSRKTILISLLALIITSLPLILFETRHGFSQTLHFISNFSVDHGSGKGLPKLIQVSEMVTKNIGNLFISPQDLSQNLRYPFIFGIILVGLFLYLKKIITGREIYPFIAMIVGVISFFSLSTSPISEYYFYSLEIIPVAICVLFVAYLYEKRHLKVFIFIGMVLLLIRNLYLGHLVHIERHYAKGYVEKKSVVEYITMNAKNSGLPCFGISYITSIGENSGFRYFFYLKKAHTVKPLPDIPTYSIVIPNELSYEVKAKFGHIGVITPKTIPDGSTLDKICQAENTNLTYPVFGYVD